MPNRNTILIPNDKSTGKAIKSKTHEIPDVFETGRSYAAKIYAAEEFHANNFSLVQQGAPAGTPQLLRLEFLSKNALPIKVTFDREVFIKVEIVETGKERKPLNELLP